MLLTPGTPPRGSRWRAFRRTRWFAAAVAATLATTLGLQVATGGASQAQTTSVPVGTASASAQLYRVNPKTASLSLGIGFGISLANFQNKAAIAESRGIDLGIIGSLLAAPGCDGGDPTLPAEDQPQPIHVEARGEGTNESESGADPSGLGIFEKYVEAQGQPRSLARTTASPVGIAGLIEMTGGRSETRTEFLPDGIREAVAISDIGTLEIAAGAVRLGGMHWEATHRSGTNEESNGQFTIGSASIAGTPIPTNDPSAVLEQVNTVLKPLGLLLTPPTAHEAAGRQFVDPLSIGVIPSEARDDLVGGLLGALQPVRDPLTQALFEASCDFKSLITVADVLVGSVSGAGSFTIDVGGVQATSREIRLSSFLRKLPVLEPSAPVLAPSAPSGPSLTPNQPSLPTTPAAPAAPAVSQPASQVKSTPVVPATSSGDGDDALALVGLVGLGLLAAVAAGDLVKMRRAQRAIPVEA